MFFIGILGKEYDVIGLDNPTISLGSCEQGNESLLNTVLYNGQGQTINLARSLVEKDPGGRCPC